MHIALHFLMVDLIIALKEKFEVYMVDESTIIFQSNSGQVNVCF
jgi:hypothetical protein